MLCFRDRTYCAELCHGCAPDCPDLLTDEVCAAARAWWDGDDPPIAVSSPVIDTPDDGA